MSSQRIPILLTGATEIIGSQVIEGLKPEYEVVHFTLARAITAELPPLLQNTPPPFPSSTLGSGNWSSSTPPQALLLGGAYQDADIESLQQLAAASSNKIPWLRVDVANKPPPQLGDPQSVREYAASVARRMKDKLGVLRAEGRLGPENGEGKVYAV